MWLCSYVDVVMLICVFFCQPRSAAPVSAGGPCCVEHASLTSTYVNVRIYTRCCLPAASDSTRSAGTAFWKSGQFGSDGRSDDDDDDDDDDDADQYHLSTSDLILHLNYIAR